MWREKYESVQYISSLSFIITMLTNHQIVLNHSNWQCTIFQLGWKFNTTTPVIVFESYYHTRIWYCIVSKHPQSKPSAYVSTRWYAFHIPHPSAECEPNRASDKYWPKKYTCKSLKGCVVVLAAPHRFPFRENVKLHPLLRRQIGPEGRGAIFGVVDNRFFCQGRPKVVDVDHTAFFL